MSDTKKHKINSKFKVGLICLGEVPISVIKFWNRKNYDKGLGECLKNGGTVEMENAEEFRFTRCTCKDEQTLFSFEL